MQESILISGQSIEKAYDQPNIHKSLIFCLTVSVLLLPVFLFHRTLLLPYQSDVAALRMFAYLELAPAATRHALTTHLEKYSPELEPFAQMLYKLRLETIYNYPLNIILVRQLDKFFPSSPYTSNIISHSVLKLAALLWLLRTSKKFMPGQLSIVYGLAISFFMYLSLTYNPFTRNDMFWFVPLQRCSALLLIAAVIIILANQRPMKTKIQWLVASGIAAILLNLFSGLFMVAFLAGYFLCLQSRSVQHYLSKTSLTTYFMLYCALTSAVVLGLVAYLMQNGVMYLDMRFLFFNLMLWMITMATSLCFLKMANSRLLKQDAYQHTARFLLPLLVVTAALSGGILILSLPEAQVWNYSSRPHFLIFQFVLRLSGIAHVVWVILVGMIARQLFMAIHTAKTTYFITTLWFGILTLSVLYVARQPIYTAVVDPALYQVTLAHLGSGSQLYNKDVLFYLAVANELIIDPTGSSVIKKLSEDSQ